jgi:lipoprotein NlpI
MWWLSNFVIVGTTLASGFVQGDGLDALLKQAQEAAAKAESKEALRLADEAIAQHPRRGEAYAFRGSLLASLHKPEKAIADFDKALTLDAKLVTVYHLRGQERFKLGQFDLSLTDFDRYLEARPSERPKHWQRGISCYYAGKFRDGAEQFDAYQKVDENDVENAVWRFLCQARVDGIEKARASLLKVGTDKRIPLMEVYALYAGKSLPANVLTATKKDNPPPEELRTRLFYAHLYLGLYFEVTGDPKSALRHLRDAAEGYEKYGYMGEVARVHCERLRRLP